uniref:C2H2-type domain-containing protein n=1 Tax=Homalodisca liturata TaxID=320908 RepID=A0A1B6JLJ5_9HEMI
MSIVVAGMAMRPPFFPAWGLPPFLFQRWGTPGSPREMPPPKLKCQSCHRLYQSKFTLWRHLKYECGKDPKFTCMFCPKRAYYKTEIWRHMKTRHGQFFTEPPNQMMVPVKPAGPLPPPPVPPPPQPQGVNL